MLNENPSPTREDEGPRATVEPAQAAPRLSTLYFYLTGDCNMACRHCWIAPKFHNSDRSEKALPFDLFKKIVGEAKELGLTAVKLTGGEPFTHPDIAAILEFLKEQDLGLTIESNGVAITPDLARLVRACKNPFVSVSLDGSKESHDWMRAVPDSYERASAGIGALVSAGIRPQVIMAVAERNKHEMASLAHHAKSLGASSVKYKEFPQNRN
jgi:SynChlorMet cassette radical SAM/SPASM protein ScmF